VLGYEPAHDRRQQLAGTALGRATGRALVGRSSTGPGRATRRGFGRHRRDLAAAGTTVRTHVVGLEAICLRTGGLGHAGPGAGGLGAGGLGAGGLGHSGPRAGRSVGRTVRRLAGGGPDHRQLDADRDRLAFLDEDLGDSPAGGRGHLGVDLVRRDLKEDLVFGDGLAHLLVPLGDGALGDGLTS